jgi:iron complex outermembrane receptor protein
MYLVRFVIIFFLLVASIQSAPVSGKKAYILTFSPFQSKQILPLGDAIREKTKNELHNLGYDVILINTSESISDVMNRTKSEDSIVISGYYKKENNNPISLFGQIYSTRTGYVIDAISITHYLSDLDGLSLPKEEFSEDDDKIIQKFIHRLGIRIKLNPKAKIYSENINDHLTETQLGKELSFPIEQEDIKKETQEIFKLLENTEVVTATRTKTKLKEAPAAIYVISSQQIAERGYRTLSDALHDVPGMDFQHNYGIYPDLIHQRGLVGGMQRTLIYVDGIPDNNLNENAMLAGSVRFPLNNVERIEVISGPASALYGANAFNGIINIIMKDGATSPGNQVDTTIGSYEATSANKFSNPGTAASFSARGVSEGPTPIQYSVFGYYYQTQGPNMGGIQGLDPKQNGATKEDPNYNYKYDPVYKFSRELCGNTMCNPDSNSVGYYWSPGYNVSGEKSYNITAKFSKGGLRFETVNWQYLQGQGTFPNGTQQIDSARQGGLGLPGFRGSRWDFKSNSMLIGYNHKISETLNVDTEGIVRNSDVLNSSREEYPNQVGPSAYYRPTDIMLSNNYSRPDYGYFGESRVNWNPTSKVSTIFGVSARHFVVGKDYGSTDRYQYSNYAMYLQQVYRPFSKLSLTLGYRRDYITTYGYASTPRVSAIYQVTKDLTFKFLLGRAFREPSAIELFSQTQQRKPNPSLTPEKLSSIEIGIGYRFSQSYYSSVQAFYNSVSDLILQVQTSDTSSIGNFVPKNPWLQNQNVGRANIYGVESESVWTVKNNLSIHFNYTYNKGYYYDLPTSLQTSPSTEGRVGGNYKDDLENLIYKELFGTGKVPNRGDIPNIAPHKAFLGITYYLKPKISFYAGTNYIDVRRTIATNPTGSVAGYQMLKINIRWEDFYAEGMFLQLQANNVLNEQFFDPGIRAATGEYYPTQHPLERRNVWLTVGYKF